MLKKCRVIAEIDTNMPRGENKEGLIIWKPGQSGNPAGKKKGTLNRSTIAKKWLAIESEIMNPFTGEMQSLTQEDIITLAMIKRARSGDINAYNAIMASAHGLPKFTGVNENDGDNDITIEIT